MNSHGLAAPEPGAPRRDLPEVEYTPDAVQRMGWRVWGVMWRELASSRELIWRLFVRDWSAQYRQTWLGYVWAVIPPLTAVAAFAFLARRRLLPIDATPIPYVAYALWGMAVWQLFVGAYLAVARSLTDAGAMIARIHFSRSALVLAALGKPLFEWLIRLAAVAVTFAVLRVTPAWTAVFVPLALLPILLLALALGMLVAVISLAGSDVANVTGLALNFGILLTPVFYPPPQTWPFVLINTLNPVAAVLRASHDLMTVGRLSAPAPYLMAWVLALLTCGLAWRFFHLAMPRVAERF